VEIILILPFSLGVQVLAVQVNAEIEKEFQDIVFMNKCMSAKFLARDFFLFLA
jgi:hypothetical protein